MSENSKPDNSGHIPNAIRAYFAVYAPDPKYGRSQQLKKVETSSYASAVKSVGSGGDAAAASGQQHTHDEERTLFQSAVGGLPVRPAVQNGEEEASSCCSAAVPPSDLGTAAGPLLRSSVEDNLQTRASVSLSVKRPRDEAFKVAHDPESSASNDTNSKSSLLKLESKSYPGRFYYFNTETGERTWL
jgi:hypothetical protein